MFIALVQFTASYYSHYIQERRTHGKLYRKRNSLLPRELCGCFFDFLIESPWERVSNK